MKRKVSCFGISLHYQEDCILAASNNGPIISECRIRAINLMSTDYFGSREAGCRFLCSGRTLGRSISNFYDAVLGSYALRPNWRNKVLTPGIYSLSSPLKSLGATLASFMLVRARGRAPCRDRPA